jgi:hypothetical protein
MNGTLFMTGKDGNMGIEVHCMDGETSRFSMTEERSCLDLIGSFKPSEFLNHLLLRMQAGKRTSIFNMKMVER